MGAALGFIVGVSVIFTGAPVGAMVGSLLGARLGAWLGARLGAWLGVELGSTVGTSVSEGPMVGLAVGAPANGASVGTTVGVALGAVVGVVLVGVVLDDALLAASEQFEIPVFHIGASGYLHGARFEVLESSMRARHMKMLPTTYANKKAGFPPQAIEMRARWQASLLSN